MPNVYLLTDEILVSEYARHASVHYEDVKEEFDKRLTIKKLPHLLLVKLHGLAIFGIDARDFLQSDEHASLTKAVAILCDPNSGYFEHGKILLENVLWIDSLKFPAKLFDDENEAIKWLETIDTNR